MCIINQLGIIVENQWSLFELGQSGGREGARFVVPGGSVGRIGGLLHRTLSIVSSLLPLASHQGTVAA